MRSSRASTVVDTSGPGESKMRRTLLLLLTCLVEPDISIISDVDKNEGKK